MGCCIDVRCGVGVDEVGCDWIGFDGAGLDLITVFGIGLNSALVGPFPPVPALFPAKIAAVFFFGVFPAFSTTVMLLLELLLVFLIIFGDDTGDVGGEFPDSFFWRASASFDCRAFIDCKPAIRHAIIKISDCKMRTLRILTGSLKPSSWSISNHFVEEGRCR